MKPEYVRDLRFLKLLQEELPLTPRPFDRLAKKAGLSPAATVKKIRALKKAGAIRRYGLVIHHRKTGYAVNAMTAVAAEPAVLKALVNRIMDTPAVTHCYERPEYPDWPFRLYFMLHAKTKAESKRALDTLFKGLLVTKKKILVSTKEFKKVSFRL